nr:MAG TPA: hypothetical protein [Caudoviricetes sp.]DAR93946.1 MAG TPA: hypothetical protein [Caudoviricetes sp.]
MYLLIINLDCGIDIYPGFYPWVYVCSDKLS